MACGGRSGLRAPAPPTAAATAAGRVSSELTDAGATSKEVWVYRRLVVGRARVEASLDEKELVIEDGDHARLVATEKRAPLYAGNEEPADLSFHEVRRKTLRGRANGSANGLELALVGDSGTTTLIHCTYERRRVAPAHAVRVLDPSFDSECGNRGIWMPSESVETTALVCSSDDDDVVLRHVGFGRAPGIELLGISEDCFMSGEGERLIPEDGALAPALERRPPAKRQHRRRQRRRLRNRAVRGVGNATSGGP